MEQTHKLLLLGNGGSDQGTSSSSPFPSWKVTVVTEYLAKRKQEAEELGLPTTTQALDRLKMQQPAVQCTEDLAEEAKLLGPVASWYVGTRGLTLDLSAKEKHAPGKAAEGKKEERGNQFVMECHALFLPVGASSDSGAFYIPKMCTELLECNWPLMYPYLLPTMFANSRNPAGVMVSDAPVAGGGGGASGSRSSGTAAETQKVTTTLNYLDWKRLRTDPSMMDRFHYSYNILLHYLGWRLHEQTTGELDRHKYWKDRYTQLELEYREVDAKLSTAAAGAAGGGKDGTGACCDDAEAAAVFAQEMLATTTPCSYLVLAPLLRTLVELRLISYAKGLLKYILQEFVNSRLDFLRPVWINVWLPFVERVEEEKPELNASLQKELKRLRTRFTKLDDSDSD